MKQLPSQEYLKECVDYDSETGLLTWKERPPNHFKNQGDCNKWNARWSGKLALNSINKDGYREGSVDSVNVHAHRVIYKLLTGEEPGVIDHDNGIASDNRFSNLNSGSQGVNCLNKSIQSNNTSGCNGVYWYPPLEKWQAKIKFDRKQKHLGYFLNFEDAVTARKAAEKELGFHKNHGRKN